MLDDSQPQTYRRTSNAKVSRPSTEEKCPAKGIVAMNQTQKIRALVKCTEPLDVQATQKCCIHVLKTYVWQKASQRCIRHSKSMDLKSELPKLKLPSNSSSRVLRSPRKAL